MDNSKHDSIIYFMIGTAGSGKSTYSEKLSKELEIPILCTDDVRKELAKRANTDNIYAIPNSEIFRILAERANEKIQKGEDFIWDATNADPKYRIPQLKDWKNINPEIKTKVRLLVTPKEVALARNEYRGKIGDRLVKSEFIEKEFGLLTQQPIDTKLEELDEITLIGTDGEEFKVYDREIAKKENLEFKIGPKEFSPRKIK